MCLSPNGLRELREELWGKALQLCIKEEMPLLRTKARKGDKTFGSLPN